MPVQHVSAQEINGIDRPRVLQMVDITISIASYNTRALLRNCLKAVYRYADGLSLEVIVVDNASMDGSPEMVKEVFPSAILVNNTRNVGFGRAHNQAFQISKGRYFLILNSDAELHAGTLREMVGFMDHHRDAGIAGCKTFLDTDNTFLFPKHPVPSIWNYVMLYTDICGRFPRSPICTEFMNHSYRLWSASRPVVVDGVDGGAMIIRRETFEETGGFDPQFFLFFEEDDLFLRARRSQWRLYYLPQTSVSHYHAGSHKNQRIGDIASRSKRHYFLKHYGVIGWGVTIAMDILWHRLTPFFERLRPDLERLSHLPYDLYETEGRLKIPVPSPDKGDMQLMELSTNRAFSPRAGAFIHGDEFIFTSDMLKRFVSDSFYWRIVTISKEGHLKKTGKTGRVLIHKNA